MFKKRISILFLMMSALLTIVVASITYSPTAKAAPAAGDVFLKNDYVEVGIHSNGYFGTSDDAPVGYHPIGRTTLGFVADNGQDGWAVGTPPQSGDYFMPGSPEQGFAVEWDYAGASYTANNNGEGTLSEITPVSLTDTSTGGTASAAWVGQAVNGSQALQITRTVSINPGDIHFSISVELYNAGSTTLDSVEYLENVDPDNGVDIEGTYETDNYIMYQPGIGGNPDTAMVAAIDTVHPSVALRLSTTDSRAKVSMGGFFVRDPDQVLDATACVPSNSTVCAPAPGTHYTDDMAVSLAYRLGSLAPDQSVTFVYYYQLSDISVNVPPIANNSTYTTTQNTTLTEPLPGVLENDQDSDGDPLTAVLDTDVTNGVLALSADGSFVYTPTLGYSGSDSFTYHANDGTVNSNIATIDINVTGGASSGADLAISQSIEFAVLDTIFIITAQNNGPEAAPDAVVSITHPVDIVVSDWTCAASGGAICPAASGTGNLPDQTLATFPSGGSVVYAMQASVNGTHANVATITPPVGVTDPDMSNNESTQMSAYLVILPLIFSNATFTP